MKTQDIKGDVCKHIENSVRGSVLATVYVATTPIVYDSVSGIQSEAAEIPYVVHDEIHAVAHRYFF